MNVSLTPQLVELIQQKVATGRYNNASEVVREALRLMEERDQEREARLRDLVDLLPFIVYTPPPCTHPILGARASYSSTRS